MASNASAQDLRSMISCDDTIKYGYSSNFKYNTNKIYNARKVTPNCESEARNHNRSVTILGNHNRQVQICQYFMDMNSNDLLTSDHSGQTQNLLRTVLIAAGSLMLHLDPFHALVRLYVTDFPYSKLHHPLW